MSARVIVLGPNGLNDATFHVHEANCADVRRPKYRHVDGSPYDRQRSWIMELDTEQQLFEEMFGDFIAENDNSWEDYRGETKVFPCVKGLA